MKKKFKKEYIVLATLIVALTLYLVLRQADRVQYRLPKLETLQTENIGKLEIQKPDGLLELTKEGDKWVLGKEKYPTDIERIEKMLKTIAALRVTELVSKSKNYNRYGLQEGERLVVKAYKDDKTLREFLVGKNTSTYSHTFVKLPGDDNVYQAKEAFQNVFNKKTDEIRDKKIMKFDSAEVTQVEISAGKQDYLFTKSAPKTEAGQKEEEKPAGETQWLTAQGKEGDKSKIDSYINRLANLTCDAFLEGKKETDLGESIFTITLKGNRDYKLTIYAKGKEDDSGYPAVSSENPYIFTLASYAAENFTKEVEKLVKEKK